MKKKLPKAILWTADDMHEAAAGTSQLHQEPHPVDLKEPQRQGVVPNSGSKDNVVDMMPKADAASATIANAARASGADIDETRRRMRALAIIERHANYSAIGGVIPLPIANMASVAAIIVRMVKSLSSLYGVPFERTRARAVVIGLMGGVMPTGLATVATSTLVYFIPGYNLIGLAVSSVTASAYARSIGQLFVEHFENGSTLIDFPSAILR
jgi:uncharacterized protein (DUF697 family)